MINILAIACGGAVGSVLRHTFNAGVMALIPAAFPFGVMAVNVAGSFGMGLLVGIFSMIHEPSQAIKLFLTVGVLGGFTTFSAFSLDAVMLWERGALIQAILYVTGSVGFSIAALAAGILIVRVLST